MTPLSLIQISDEAAELGIVTTYGEATSLEFGHIAAWGGMAAMPVVIRLPSPTLILNGAGTFDLSKAAMSWDHAAIMEHLRWNIHVELSVAEAHQEFADLIHDIPEVESVVSSLDESVIHVWTYLDAGPFETSTRHRIYDAEEYILNLYPDTEIEFHLTNLAEYPSEMHEGLRMGDSVLYERRPNAIEGSAPRPGN